MTILCCQISSPHHTSHPDNIARFISTNVSMCNSKHDWNQFLLMLLVLCYKSWTFDGILHFKGQVRLCVFLLICQIGNKHRFMSTYLYVHIALEKRRTKLRIHKHALLLHSYQSFPTKLTRSESVKPCTAQRH